MIIAHASDVGTGFVDHVSIQWFEGLQRTRVEDIVSDLAIL